MLLQRIVTLSIALSFLPVFQGVSHVILQVESNAGDPTIATGSGGDAERPNIETNPLSLSKNGRVWMTYNADVLPSPEPDEPWYKRSGFIHPVLTPAGRAVTEAFPADHLHQHGLMFAWTSGYFDGHPIDFWNSRVEQGHVEHVETVHADPNRIVARLRHVDDRGETPTTVLNEKWVLTRVDHPSMNVFDLESTQTCATDRPLEIKKYHYGAMCIRGPSAWLGGKATMSTSEGDSRQAGNHSRPDWVAMQGEIDGAKCGIAAIGHPGNFRHPQPVRLHPDKPYFCFAPMVLGDFQIAPGQAYISRFRFVAFDGEIDRAQLDAIATDFAESK